MTSHISVQTGCQQNFIIIIIIDESACIFKKSLIGSWELFFIKGLNHYFIEIFLSAIPFSSSYRIQTTLKTF